MALSGFDGVLEVQRVGSGLGDAACGGGGVDLSRPAPTTHSEFDQ